MSLDDWEQTWATLAPRFPADPDPHQSLRATAETMASVEGHDHEVHTLPLLSVAEGEQPSELTPLTAPAAAFESHRSAVVWAAMDLAS